MKQNKETEIYEIDGISVTGSANIWTNTILLHKGLNEFPDLKRFVLRHEMQHIKDHSYLKALWLDLKDYPKIYARKDFWQFQKKYIETSNSHEFKDFMYRIISNMAILPVTMIYGAILLMMKNGKRKNKTRCRTYNGQ